MSRLRTLFVTGTDTGVGKTHVSAALLRAARAEGLRVCGYKPVASGCESDAAGRLRNEDALALLAASAAAEPYEAINPYAFAPPIAPHVAAREAGGVVDLARLDAGAEALAARHDWLLVEGAGGWLVPLSADAGFADWVAARGWPVLLVVGMRLGCINHALLTAEAVRARGLELVGWVANELPPLQDRLVDSLEAIAARIGAPLLGRMPAGADAASAPAAALFGALRARLGVGAGPALPRNGGRPA